LSVQATREFRLTPLEVAQELSKSKRKLGIFKAVYAGGNLPKNATAIASVTELSEQKVLALGSPMAHKGFFEKVEDKNSRVAYKKLQPINAIKQRILSLAKNAKALAKEAGEKTPKGTLAVIVRVKQAKDIRVTHFTIDDVGQFKRIRALKAQSLRKLTPARLPEKVFKYGVAKLLGNRGTFRDWGGEKNDLYTTQLEIKGRRRPAAVAFKGKGTPPPLTPKKLGKNGDQIQRLFSSAAEVFLIQFEGRIDESVPEQMISHAVRKSHETGKEIFYGIAGLEDSHRLRATYPNFFTADSIPIEDR
jgi:hypothetical protein